MTEWPGYEHCPECDDIERVKSMGQAWLPSSPGPSLVTVLACGHKIIDSYY